MKPVHEFIPRTIEKDDIQETLNKLASGLEEFVNFGSWIVKWDIEKMSGGDENVPIVMSFRHLLETIDSISILVKHSSIDPCKLLLRGVLETYFGLEYLFENDTYNRCIAFITWHFNKKIKTYKKLDPSTEQGKQFQKALEDYSSNTFSLKNNSKIPISIQSLESLLNTPKYQNAQQELQRLKDSGEKNPAWYRLFEGPRNIEALAKHLKMTDLYEILYRHWSGPTHGTDVFSGKLFAGNNGMVEIPQIRYVKDIQEVVQWACTISLKAFKVYIDNRLPEKENDYKDWNQTIQKFYLRVNSQKPIISVN